MSVRDIDAIVFATEYDFSFPFLKEVEVWNRRIRGLYQHVSHARDPTLGFVGMVSGRFKYLQGDIRANPLKVSGGVTFRVFEWQAVAVARYFAGRATLPPRPDMEQWEKDRISVAGDGLGFFNIVPDYEEYFEGLRSIAGDPVRGSTGRTLPRFEKWWEDEFQKVVKARVGWWEREMSRAARDAEGRGKSVDAVVGNNSVAKQETVQV